MIAILLSPAVLLLAIVLAVAILGWLVRSDPTDDDDALFVSAAWLRAAIRERRE